MLGHPLFGPHGGHGDPVVLSKPWRFLTSLDLLNLLFCFERWWLFKDFNGWLHVHVHVHVQQLLSCFFWRDEFEWFASEVDCCMAVVAGCYCIPWAKESLGQSLPNSDSTGGISKFLISKHCILRYFFLSNPLQLRAWNASVPKKHLVTWTNNGPYTLQTSEQYFAGAAAGGMALSNSWQKYIKILYYKPTYCKI